MLTSVFSTEKKKKKDEQYIVFIKCNINMNILHTFIIYKSNVENPSTSSEIHYIFRLDLSKTTNDITQIGL